MRWKWLAVVGGVLAVALVVVVLVRPRPVRVDVATVARGPFERVVQAEGRTDLPQRVLVTAPLSGEMTAIGLRAGDDVARGAILTILTPLPLPLMDPASVAEATDQYGMAQARLSQARADVKRATARSDLAQRELVRLRALLRGGAVGEREVERAAAEVRAAQADVQVVRMAVHGAEPGVAVAQALRARVGREPARAVAERQPVPAPLTGRILRVLRDDAGVVAAGEPLVELADPASLEVVLDVPSEDAVALQPGQSATLYGWGGPALLSGRVRRIEPRATTRLSALGVEEQRVDVRLELLAGPPTALGDGYRVEARVVVDRLADVVVAPTGALWRDGAGWAVYVVREGRAARQAVGVGPRDAEHFVVQQSLKPGDRVILHPPEQVREGVRVEAIAPPQ
jgi:HlyD family secretion protein